MTDPVILSGGDSGGEIVEGSDWQIGDIRIFGVCIYRRDGNEAVYTGLATAP